MRRLAILFISIIGILGLSIASKMKGVRMHDEIIDQTNYQIDREAMIKPNDLAPSHELKNLNANNIFISDYFAPHYFSNLKGVLAIT